MRGFHPSWVSSKSANAVLLRVGVRHLPQAAKLVVHERETILAALEDMPPELTELRGVLLRELTTLRSEGIV